MGMLLGRTSSEAALPEGLRSASVSEEEALSTQMLYILSCPLCHQRLCTLGRGVSAASDPGSASSKEVPGTSESSQGALRSVWKVPASRIEKAWLGGSCSIKCRACGAGRVVVEVLPAQPGDDLGGSTEGSQTTAPRERRVLLRPSGSLLFRPFSVCVCGTYESVVARVATLFQVEAVTAGRSMQVTQCTLRRSQLVQPPEDSLTSGPLELVVIAHRIAGQRNPLTDAQGLYSKLLAHAWTRADAVLLCLLDMPRDGYFAQLLEEQPTLQGLLSTGRLLPLFAASQPPMLSREDDQACCEPILGGTEATTLTSMGPDEAAEAAEAAWWFIRSLDGRLPRVDAFAGLAAGASGSTRNAWRSLAAEAAAAGSRSGSTLSALAPVAESFESQVLIRD